MTILLLLILASATGAQPQSTPATTSPVATAAAEITPAIDALIVQLADPRFDVRAQATRRLCQSDLSLLPALVGRYKADRSHERKLRLREVIENLFMRKQMLGEVGFLGIQLVLAENVVDPNTGRPAECVFAQKVIKDFPAAQAGMQDGDIIVSLDNKPASWFLGAAPPPAAGAAHPQAGAPGPGRRQAMTNEKIIRFTQHIKRRTPGAKVAVRILRSSSPRRITVGAATQPPQTLDGATFVPVPGCMIGPGPMSAMNTRGGLMVRTVAPGSAAQLATLKPNDIIVTLNGVALPAEADPTTVGQYFKNAAPGSPVTIEAVETRELQLSVTVGRRPVDRMNPEDLIEARERFALWWRDQSGENSIQRPSPSQNYFTPAELQQPVAPEAGVAP